MLDLPNKPDSVLGGKVIINRALIVNRRKILNIFIDFQMINVSLRSAPVNLTRCHAHWPELDMQRVSDESVAHAAGVVGNR